MSPRPNRCFVLPALGRASLLGAIAASSADADSTGAPADDGVAVSPVIVTGAHPRFMLADDSTRLVAMPVNATHGVVSSPSIAWTSSVSTVAGERAAAINLT